MSDGQAWGGGGVMGTGCVVEVGMVVRTGIGVRGHWSAGISDCGHLVFFYFYTQLVREKSYTFYIIKAVDICACMCVCECVCVCVCYLCVRHRTPQKLLGLGMYYFAHICVSYPAIM